MEFVLFTSKKDGRECDTNDLIKASCFNEPKSPGSLCILFNIRISVVFERHEFDDLKGVEQLEGVVCDECFGPIASHRSIRRGTKLRKLLVGGKDHEKIPDDLTQKVVRNGEELKQKVKVIANNDDAWIATFIDKGFVCDGKSGVVFAIELTDAIDGDTS